MSEPRAPLANAWLRSRQRSWTQWLRDRQRPRDLPVAEAQRYVERYRALAADLATARRMLPGSATTAALETLYANAHTSIDRSRRQRSGTLRQPSMRFRIGGGALARSASCFAGAFRRSWARWHRPFSGSDCCSC